jgi:hypothetical protein
MQMDLVEHVSKGKVERELLKLAGKRCDVVQLQTLLETEYRKLSSRLRSSLPIELRVQREPYRFPGNQGSISSRMSSLMALRS